MDSTPGPTDDIRRGERSFVVWDDAIWHRTWREAREGGFDGYRTVFPPRRELACADLADEAGKPGRG